MNKFNIDLTLNIPTLITILIVFVRLGTWYQRVAHKIDTMWVQFLIDHPEYERREGLRLKG